MALPTKIRPRILPSIAPLMPIAERGRPFTSADGQAFFRIPLAAGGYSICPVRSAAFREWFFSQFFVQYDTLPTPQAFRSILQHLEACASADSYNQRLSVFRRVGSRQAAGGGRQILLDLANPDGEFVEISADGWKVAAGHNALLETSRPNLALPRPVLPPEGTASAPLQTLRSCLNLASRPDWLRCLAWLMASLRPSGPCPFLILQGPPGSGKSLTASVLRSLVDPCSSPFTPIPGDPRTLLALARHNWILAFDHISALSPQLIDALCRLSSSAGASCHEPGAVEALQQSYRRPVLLTVTSRWSCPADFASRALTVNLPAIAPAARRTEDSIVTELTEAWPAILGSLCSAVAAALRSTADGAASEIRFPSAPRYADAFLWAMAASPALDCTSPEMHDAMQGAFDPQPPPHPMVVTVRNLLEQRRCWTGSASDLLALLQPALSCVTPKGVSQQLHQCMLTLSEAGIEIKFRRLHGGARVIHLLQDPGDASSPKSPQDASPGPELSLQPTETEGLAKS